MNYYKRLFTSKIWSRGDLYFRSGRVSNFTIEEGNYLCNVKGSDHYEVYFIINNNKINNMLCDCPYAQGGNYCKHMAAAVMKLEAEGYIRSDGRIGKPKVAKNEWEQVVFLYIERGCGTRQDIKALDRALSQKIIDLQNSITKDKSKKNIKVVLNELSFAHKALNYLEVYLELKTTLAALGLMIQVIKDIDKNALTMWARKQIRYAKRNDIYNLLVPIAFTNDEEGLDALNKQMASLDEDKNVIVFTKCIKIKIKILEELNYSPKQIIENLQDYTHNEVVMNYKLNYYMSINDFVSAEKTLQNLLKMTNLSYQEKQDVEDQLADLYVKAKNKEKYKKYLLQKVKEIRSIHKINYLETLKSMYDNEREWANELREFAQTLKGETPYYVLIELYKNAKEYGIMFELLYSRYDLKAFLQYKDLLIQYNKSFYLHAIYQFITEQLDNAYSRENYYDIIDSLYELKNDANCSILLQDIMIYAKENHGRKVLLIDMLENLYDEN